MSSAFNEEFRITSKTGLSSREEQVVLAAARGLTDKEIAAELRISPGTARTYWERMRRKLGARNRAEIMAMTFEKMLFSATERAKDAESLMDSLLNQVLVGVAVAEAVSAEIIYVNAAMKRMCEGPLGGMAERPAGTGRKSKIRATLDAIASRCAEGPCEVELERSRYAIRVAAVRRGTRNLLIYQANDLSRTNEGMTLGSVANSLFRAVVDAGEGATLVVSRNGTILFASEEAHRVLRRGNKELAARKLQEICREPATMLGLLEEVARRGSKFEISVRLKDPSGNAMPFLANLKNRLRDRALRGIVLTLEKDASTGRF